MNMKKMRTIGRCGVATVLMLAVLCGGRAFGAPADEAKQILEATGVKGGLIVHVGCGDGKLTAALRANDATLVHGLDADAKNVAAAREHIRSLGLYGKVSVEQRSPGGLPYTDDLVNLLVVEDARVPMPEVMRVLAPGGVAYVKQKGKWAKTVKPVPDEIDEWSHFMHDASNNAVAADTRVDTPRRLRWLAGPLWARSHEFNSSLCAMVSAGGRIFYIFDEGLTGVTPSFLPERWTLIARDAFNGVLLWKRTVPKWGTGQWKTRALRNVPGTIPRRLVAAGDRVFMTLGYEAPVSVLDAATGKILSTWKDTAKAQELRYVDGVVLLCRGRGAVRAVDAGTGETLWENTGKIQAFSLAARDGKAFYQADSKVFCVGLRDGKMRWQVPAKSPISKLIACGDRVLLGSRGSIQAVSIDTGKVLWTAKASLAGRGELFVTGGKAWHWEGHNIVGRDLQTGKLVETVDTADAFTEGHHLRCYPSKATTNFMITPYRGAEFISLTGGANTQNDWVRGPCTYGIMPGNGLLYAPPDPCFCFPGVKLTGFNALAGLPPKGTFPKATGPRLEKGPAFGAIDNRQSSSAKATEDRSAIDNSTDWPTYRHDGRRTGATACDVPAAVSPTWSVKLTGRLTPPVAVGGRVYVAAKDEHTIHALGIEDGRTAWRFTAGGRIDSPPTIHGGAVLFGCVDGYVYCLRASDGALAWRFRAAPSDERIIAFGQLESPWRVHGSVLVEKGVAYCTAGRSTKLDGGIYLYGLDPATGKVVHENRLDSWSRTRTDAEGKLFIPAYHIEGSHSDILVSEGGSIYLGQYKLDRSLAEQMVPYALPDAKDKSVPMDLTGEPYISANLKQVQGYESHQRNWVEKQMKAVAAEYRKKYGGFNFGNRDFGRHVFSTGGFLDGSYYNRTIWTYSGTWPGFYLAHLGAKTGHLLVVGPEKTYALQAYPTRNMQSPLFTPGEKGYLLFADKNANDPVLGDRTRETTKGWGFTRKAPPVWHEWTPIRIRSMVLAGPNLFVAGPPDVVDPDDPMGAFEGRKGAVLRVVSAADGKKLAERKLDAPPVFDGLIAAQGRLLMCTTDGKVICFGKGK
jgi:outer membrane protein assembly factor BamB